MKKKKNYARNITFQKLSPDLMEFKVILNSLTRDWNELEAMYQLSGPG